ncbi:hypothetical protein PHYSODRAFT_510051 [Phytophthora sojae]|uniref:Uncharacterized protein n=1 Tax=Phytophthora sojae (strain P6497) TaxID=1094619 RepID=G4ZLK4_PHYSP|nr:hypothetical protein PHYSODRAFT_510051 [Phytophthora sojae]EGZ14579.1 hypothetical protein PHYSODRAFT_510051 [Phytophthora sojae]|eukprot:XP_009528328.1 hypothetical protein PHYSODRAFT_510051 [Phytophthora sojae]
MYNELIISSGVPAHKLRKAANTGKLSLTAAELQGSGAKIHLHPESHEKALKAKKAGRGVRLHITKHEIKKGYKRAQGGSIWSKIWHGIKSGFKFAKDSGLLSKAADVAVPAVATAFGAPEAGIAARAGLISLTGVGLDGYESDEEGGRISFSDVKRHAGSALRYSKTRGIITDLIDEGEKYLVSKSDRPEHHEMIHSVRRGIKTRFGVGVAGKRRKAKFTKGSPEAKAHMAKLRAMRKNKDGGSFTM